MTRTSVREDKKIHFFEGDALVGSICYGDKSEHFILDAVQNWESGVFKKEDVIKFSQNPGPSKNCLCDS